MLFGVARVPLDALAVLAALLVSYRLREAQVDLVPGVQLLEPALSLPPIPIYISSFVAPGILVFLFFAAFVGLYGLRATVGAWEEVGRIIIATALWLLAVISWYFLIEKELFYSRVLLLHCALLTVLLVGFARSVLVLLQRSFLARGIGRTLVVSVGSHPLVRPARETLEHDIRYRYLGHIEDMSGIKRVAERRDIDLVLQTDPNPNSEETLRLIDYCRSHHIGYGFLPPVLADVPHQLHVERLGLLPLIRFQPTPLDGWGRVFKRVVDIGVSAAFLVFLWPIFFLIAVAILIDSGWPVSYESLRVGEQGRRRIKILKFRTMILEADRQRRSLSHLSHRADGPLFKIRNDPRVTRVGRMLRRFSLDELPQLINVFLGHMSLVGPRPHLPEEVDRYSLEQRRVFAVKPGITGLAQISGRSDLRFEDEVRLDLQYIEEWSILLDLWILWRTVFVIIGRKGDD